MVEYTKKSRNIRHKTLKNRQDNSKIVGGQPFGFTEKEKANKKLPVFDDFFNGFDNKGTILGNAKDNSGTDNLYEIQYLTDPTKKYNVFNQRIIPLGNAYFIGKGSNFINDTTTGKNGLPIDFSGIYTPDASLNTLEYIVFELIDHQEYKGPISLKDKIIIYTDNNNIERHFAIIYKSDNCPYGGNTETRNKNPICKDDSVSRYFSHYIINLKNKTIADVQSRFASGNLSNSIADTVRRIFGPDSYLTIFKNEKFLPFMNPKLYEKYKGCKDIGSKLCKDLNEKNSEFTRTTDIIKNTDKFTDTDFKNINYLRLLFAIKYHFIKANDLGRMDIISIIFHLFKINFLNDEEKQGIFNEKLKSSQITMNVNSFMQNNASILPTIIDMIGKVLIDGFHWYVFRDVKLTKDNIKELIDKRNEILQEEEKLNETDEEEAKDVAIAIDIAETDVVLKGGRPKSIDLQKDNINEIETKKIIGGKPSRNFVDNLVAPDIRFDDITNEARVKHYTDSSGVKHKMNLKKTFFTQPKIKPLQTTRLGPLGTIQSTNKISVIPIVSEFSNRLSLVDNNIFIKLINKYININEFTNPTIYEEYIQDILLGTLVSFFLKMYEINQKDQPDINIDELINDKIKPFIDNDDKKRGPTVTRLEQYIMNVYQILFMYYRRNFKDDNTTNDKPKYEDSHIRITQFVTLLVELVKIKKKEEDQKSQNYNDEENIILSTPIIDPVNTILQNADFLNKRKATIKILKEIIINKYKDPLELLTNGNPSPNHTIIGETDLKPSYTYSLYMLYDFHDIVEFFHFKNNTRKLENSNQFQEPARKYSSEKIGQNYPVIIVLNDSEIEAFIDKNNYIEYIFVVDEWVKELVQVVGKDEAGKKEIADFMIAIAGCLIEGVKQKCTSISGIVGSVATSLFTFGKTPPLPCLTGATLLVRTVMAEWLDKTTLMQFTKNAQLKNANIKSQRDSIEAAKKSRKESVDIKAISSKEPMCYVQFGADFAITYIYVQNIDGENNIFYIKHDHVGSPVQGIKPIPKADILKYLVSTDLFASTWVPSSEPKAKLIASPSSGPSAGPSTGPSAGGKIDVLSLLKQGKFLTGFTTKIQTNMPLLEGTCLANIGASCYINVVIQLLFCIPEIRALLLSNYESFQLKSLIQNFNEKYKEEDTEINNTINDINNKENTNRKGIITKIDDTKFTLEDIQRITYLTPLFRELENKSKTQNATISANDLLNKYKLIEFLTTFNFTPRSGQIAVNEQQDAAEALNILLNSIRMYTSIFNFMDINSNTCYDNSRNNNIELNIVIEHKLDVQVTNSDGSIFTTVQQCIDAYQNKENIDESNKKLDACGDKGRSHQQHYIYIFNDTKYMIVVLKRFTYDKTTYTLKKLSHDVDIKQFVVNGATFKIKGAALHGGTITGGHYVFAEYDSNGNISRVFNDSTIETADKQSGRTPYILLYERQP